MLRYPDVPLQALLDDAAESYPNATATIFFNAKRTYRSISEDAWRFANGLRRVGVEKGDRVALVLPNTPQFVVAFYGALRAGAVLVCCNPRYTAAELQHQLADAGATVVVVLSRLYPLVKAARPGTAVERVIVTNIKEEMPPVLRLLFTVAKEKKDGHRQPFAGDAGALAFREVLAARPEPFDAGVRADDLALLQYTGGTTGVSKGAMLSHRALVANTLQCRAWFTNMRDGEGAAMAVMPFFHVYGLTVVMSLSVQGAEAMILEPQLELEHLLKDIQRHRPRMFSGAPIIYNAINNSPLTKKYDLRSIEACVSGSAPLLNETHRRFVELTGAKIVDRKKEMIIVSGFKVYPRDVEEVLVAHPAVTDAAVIGIPHPTKGEEVKAYVVLRPGGEATADEIIAHCRKTLADFKVPRQVEFRASLPHTVVGKTLRKELAAEEQAKRKTAVPA